LTSERRKKHGNNEWNPRLLPHWQIKRPSDVEFFYSRRGNGPIYRWSYEAAATLARIAHATVRLRHSRALFSEWKSFPINCKPNWRALRR